MQVMRLPNESKTDFFQTNKPVKFKRKAYLPVKLTVLLVVCSLSIAAILVFAFYSYPFITLAALVLGILLFILFVKPKSLSFIEEEYAPDHFINDTDKNNDSE